LGKLCLFTLAATLAGSVTVGTLNVQIQEYEVPSQPLACAVEDVQGVYQHDEPELCLHEPSRPFEAVPASPWLPATKSPRL
jgi:hypothetical protein